MSSHDGPPEADERYTTAHDAHFAEKDQHAALGLYEDLLSDFPESQEAGYARSQIQNIVHNVVPLRVLVEIQAELARQYFEGPVEESTIVELATSSRQQDASPAPEQGD